MHFNRLHSWHLTIPEAHDVQVRLRDMLILDEYHDINAIKTIAAADISYSKFSPVLFAAVVLFRFPELELAGVFLREAPAAFPYVPGYLSFRELPVILDIFEEINSVPDVILCDAHGIAHPRGMGLASHLGLVLDIPAIGCAKSVLVGEYRNPSAERGSFTPLQYKEKTVGMAVRTRRNVKPVFVSVGHRFNLGQAVELVLRCAPRYRIPEPLRVAHQKVNEFRIKMAEENVP